MIKKFRSVVLLLLPLLTKAQVNVNVQMPPAGLVQKEQLWNLVLVSNSNEVLDITLQLNLQDAATGQVVLTATTGNLLLSKGVKMIKSPSLQPVNYTYNLTDFSRSYIPMGSYIACYQVINAGARKEAPIAQECIRFAVDPLSPPLLSSPANKGTVTTPYPQFTWMPPAPFDMFSSLNYDLLVAEVLEGQSATEAIQYNNPIYTRSNLTQPYDAYASSFTKLDTGKIYAWQVVAKNGLNYAAKTEVWTFKIGTPKPEVLTPANGMYVELKPTGSGIISTAMIPDNILGIKYYSYDKRREAQVVFRDETGMVIKQETRTLEYGNNFIVFRLEKGFEKDMTYKVEISDAETNIYQASFRMIVASKK